MTQDQILYWVTDCSKYVLTSQKWCRTSTTQAFKKKSKIVPLHYQIFGKNVQVILDPFNIIRMDVPVQPEDMNSSASCPSLVFGSKLTSSLMSIPSFPVGIWLDGLVRFILKCNKPCYLICFSCTLKQKDRLPISLSASARQKYADFNTPRQREKSCVTHTIRS